MEWLERDRITTTEKGWRVRFHGPVQSRWKNGVQTVFVVTVPNRFLAEPYTPWILQSDRWRTGKTVTENGKLSSAER